MPLTRPPLLVQSIKRPFHTTLFPHTIYLTPDPECSGGYSGGFVPSALKLTGQKLLGILGGAAGQALDSGSRDRPPTWRASWAIKAIALKGLHVIDDVRFGILFLFSFFFFFFFPQKLS